MLVSIEKKITKDGKIVEIKTEEIKTTTGCTRIVKYVRMLNSYTAMWQPYYSFYQYSFDKKQIMFFES